MSYDYTKFNTGSGWRYNHTRETYSATRGGNFKRKPDIITTGIVTGDFYINFITAIPFFNDRYNGECCRATWNYTPAGYIPTRVTTSKKGYTKYIDIFTPIV